MKNIISHFAIFACSLIGAFAQPSYNLQLAPAGSISKNQSYTLSEVNPGPAGANQTWSFTLPDTGIPAPIFEYLLPSNTPYPDSFPTSTMASKTIVSQGPIQYQLFSYYRSTGNITEQVGSIFILQQTTATSRYSNPETLIWNSLPYNQIQSDNFYSIRLQNLGGTIFTDTSYGSKTIIYDAYGSISTPQGLFGNVVRLKQSRILSSNNPLASDFKNTTYFWVKAGPVVYDPVFSLSIDTSDGIDGGIVVRRNAIVPRQLTNTKILFSDSEVSVFPNPVSDKLNIRFTPKNGESLMVTIFDMQGRKYEAIPEVMHQEGLVQVETQKLPPGLYSVKFSQGKMVRTFRFKKD